MTKCDRMRAFLSVKYFEKKNYTMYPMISVQAVLLISVDVELCLRISTSGDAYYNIDWEHQVD